MLTLKTSLYIASLLTMLAFSGIEPVQANSEAVEAQTNGYATARQELPSEFYALYRIVERIARANAYDTSTWRVAIVPKYDANAFAADINLIAIHDRVLEQVGGDSSALACILAHEMGHQVKRHLPITEAQKNAYIDQIRAEVEQEVSGQKKRPNIAGSAVRIVGSAIANRLLPGLMGDLVGGIIGNRSSNRSANTHNRIEQLVESRTKELEKHLNERNYQQELEADEIAYFASVRAGFEPAGCLRAMQVLERFASLESQTNQSNLPQRITAMKTLISKNVAQILIVEGTEKIMRSQPLTYELSRENKSLQIHPRYGGSAVQDLDRLFGGS